MKNDWKKAVNEINRKRYQIPAGWDTREQVAEKLECSPDRVADLLKPGIQSGEFERQDFSVWDDTRRLACRVTCYRLRPEGTKGQLVATEGQGIRAKVLNALARNPHYDNRRIAKNTKTTSEIVAQIRAELEE
jgi:hypothetical protein